MIKVLIVDDHTILREGLGRRSAATGPGFLQKLNIRTNTDLARYTVGHGSVL
jgi:hypothetical protein